MMRPLPEGWREPLPITVQEQLYGYELGLVPAGHIALRQAAELVPPDEITGPDAQDIVQTMFNILVELDRIQRRPLGLAAPQIGRAAQVIMVPKPADSTDETYGSYMPVFNPKLAIDHDAGYHGMAHGCFSANELFVRLPSPQRAILRGYDIQGRPFELERSGRAAIVDQHEVMHLEGVRAADVAVRYGTPIDWRPETMLQEYRDFLTEHPPGQFGLPIPEWRYSYNYDQWAAVKSGEFDIRDYA